MAADIAAILFGVLLGGLGMLQLALALGAPLGRFAWGGGQERLSAGLRIASVIAILVYATFAAIALERAGVAHVLPDPSIASVGIWAIVAYLALGIPLNAVSRSKPERYAMTPLAMALAALALVIALSPTPAASP